MGNKIFVSYIKAQQIGTEESFRLKVSVFGGKCAGCSAVSLQLRSGCPSLSALILLDQTHLSHGVFSATKGKPNQYG